MRKPDLIRQVACLLLVGCHSKSDTAPTPVQSATAEPVAVATTTATPTPSVTPSASIAPLASAPAPARSTREVQMPEAQQIAVLAALAGDGGNLADLLKGSDVPAVDLGAAAQKPVRSTLSRR